MDCGRREGRVHCLAEIMVETRTAGRLMKVTGAPLPEAPDTQSAAVYLLTELRKWEKPYNATDPLGLDASDKSASASGVPSWLNSTTSTDEELARASAIIASNTPSNPTTYGSPNYSGAVVPVTTKTMDCTAFVSAVTQTPYTGTASLVTPAGYSKSFTSVDSANYQAGDIYVVRYKDANGNIVGHAQLNMGNGQYADSVDAANRSGPGLTQKNTQAYLAEKCSLPLSFPILSRVSFV